MVLSTRPGSPPRAGIFKGLMLATSLAMLGIATVRPAAAVPFVVSAQALSAVGNISPGANAPSIYGSPVSSVSGWCVVNMNPPNWSEFKFSAPSDGLYSLKMNYATPLAGVGVTIDVHASGSPLHYAAYGISTPTTGDWVGFLDTAVITVPLKAGTNVIRVENTLAFNAIPHSSGNTGNGVNIGGFTLDRTANLPTSSNVSGAVASSDLGIPVGGAIVMVEDPAKTVAEPGFNWYNGYWTTTAGDGTYSIPVPAGTYTVQAGRPDTYALAGATKTGVAAGSSGNNLTLASRWAANALLLSVAYYHGIGGNGMGLQAGAFGALGYSFGWTDPGDYVDLWVDVAPAQAGWYAVDHIYQNGGVTGSVSYTTDRGSTSTDTTPNTGDWGITATKRFANPIYLFAGKNSVRQIVISPNSNICEFKLTKTTNTATSVKVKLANFLNQGAGASASPTGGSGGVNIIPTNNVVGLDGLMVEENSIGGFSTWSTGGAPKYVEFNINAPKSAWYTLNLRAGTPVGQVSLRVSNLSYGFIVDNTILTPGSDFSEDKYNTFIADYPVPLIEGPNRIRVAITDAGMNADYIDFVYSADLTGWGKVSGVVTAGGQPVSSAQVSADVSVDAIPGVPAIGFRAVTDNLGRYSLYAPEGIKIVEARALGYDDATAPGASASVTLAAATPVIQNFTLTLDGKYEAEWFTNARRNDAQPSMNFAISAYDGATASQGQFLTSFGNTDYALYTVIAPAAGIYTLSLNYGVDDVRNIKFTVPETGTDFVEAVPSSGGFNTYADYVLTHNLVLNAGANTVRLTNVNGGGEINVDYFTLTPTGQQAAIVTGTVMNVTPTPNVPIPGVTVTATDSTSTVVGSTTTDSNGQFAFALSPGAYTFTASKTGFNSAPKSATVAAGSNPAVNLQMTQGLIKGYVKNQLGDPIVGTRVIAYIDATGMLYDPNNNAYDVYKLNQTVTDATGYYEMAVSPGSAFVVAGAPMSIPATATVSATPTATLNLVVTKLSGGTPVDLNFVHDWFSDPATGSTPNGLHDMDGIFSLPGAAAAWTPTSAYGPATTTLFDVPFEIGDPKGVTNNVLSLDAPNNVITMPQGKYDAVVVLATSSNGAWPSDRADLYSDGSTVPSGGALIVYTDGTSDTVLFHLPNWGYNQGAYGKEWRENVWEVIQWSYRWVDGQAGPEFIKFNGVASVLPANPNKTLKSINLTVDPDVFAGTNPFVFAVTVTKAAATPASASKTLKIVAGLLTATSLDVTLNDTDGDGKLTLKDAVVHSKAGRL